jgi:hypothetical protein
MTKPLESADSAGAIGGNGGEAARSGGRGWSNWLMRGACRSRRCPGLIGRNASYLQQFVQGSPRKLEEVDRGTLARFFGVDEASWARLTRWCTFRWCMERARCAAGAGLSAPRSQAEWADIPRLALGASAGPGRLANDEVPVGRLRFSSRWLKAQGLDPAMLSVIEVEGDRWSRRCATATKSWSTAPRAPCAPGST